VSASSAARISAAAKIIMWRIGAKMAPLAQAHRRLVIGVISAAALSSALMLIIAAII